MDRARFPADVRAGIGAAEGPDRSWHDARTALRFTTTRRPVVHHDELEALALLAQVPQDTARDNPDVAAIARIAGTPDDLETLDAYCATGSLRRAANLTEPNELLRASLALTAWRLLDG